MNATELNSIGIRQWDNIKTNYKNPDLLLGNGFSINLSEKFSYSSLFETFISKTKDPFNKLFKEFETTNFELILSYLTHSLKVNTILKLETDLIERAIESLKNGLIESIREIHPRVEDIDWKAIETFTDDLRLFGNIYSTNYDLFLYHIIMKSIDKKREDTTYIAYQDYFWGDTRTGYKKFMRTQDYPYKHVYYLHGALFIFNHGIYDLKIIRKGSKTELIDIIASEITSGHFPLFVTEGTAKDKLNSILRSNYLHFCLENFSKSITPLLIFGNSLSDFDKHIIKALNDNQRELIIAIHTYEKTITQIEKEKYVYLDKFGKYTPSIEFVDSKSIFTLIL